jgi:membrane-associated phospholipid phosphatase
MVGIVALTFFVIGLSQYVEIPMLYTISTLILLIGFVASSRLVMKAHTFTELILGFICGALPQIIFWPLWL